MLFEAVAVVLAVPVAEAGEFASGVKAEVTVSRLRVTPGAMARWGWGKIGDCALGRSASAGIAARVGGSSDSSVAPYSWSSNWRMVAFTTENEQEADEEMCFFGLNRWSLYDMISTPKTYLFYLLCHIYCDTLIHFSPNFQYSALILIRYHTALPELVVIFMMF